jgi:hypothetical protein
VTRHRVRLAELLCGAGGGALLASAFLHWVRRGAGSRLRGHDLVDTLITVGRDVPGATTSSLLVLWYLVPAMGALTWITLGLAGVDSRATRAVACAAAVVVAATLYVFARLAGAGDLGLGALLALLGAAAVVAGAFLAAR